MSASVEPLQSCPQCGVSLTPEAPKGLCPRCLFSQAMRPPPEETVKLKKAAVPLPEEMASHFPNYEILRILGRGGMGAVYLARQTSLNRLVAIKILPAELDDGENNFTQRFKNEAQAMAQLSHPGIVAVYDFGQTTSGLLYIVMEYIDGTDVALMVERQGRLPSAHAMAITAHVCDALAYAHGKGIIHRDIKPSNIMIGYDGVVKVADFGLAKMSQTEQSGLTQSGMVMGTLHFMAPEALTLGRAVDQRADIYAVGVMLYQMLTGKLPQGLFEMPSLQVKGLDPRYDGIVAKALREDRNLRYASAVELRHDLDAILTQPVAGVEASAAEAPNALNAQARPRKPGTVPDPRHPARAAAAARIGLHPQAGKKSSTALLCTLLLVAAVFGGAAWLVLHQPKDLPALAATDSLTLPVGTSGMDQVVDVDFTKSHKGFHAKTSTNAIKAEWLEGNYKLSLSKRGTWWPSQPVLHDLLLEDFVCEVEARVSGSSEGAWGVGMIRLAEPRHPWTGVKLDAASNVEVYSYDEQSLVPLTATRAGSADKWSTLRVESTGARLRIFLDGVLVVETQDMHRVKPCALTLFLEANAQFEAEFRSIRVWRPKGTGSTITPTSSLPPATKELPFINTLGMKFVPVSGTKVLFCIHETRRQDYAAYANEVPGVNGSWKLQHRDGIPCGDKDDHPVVGVSWEDSVKFCEWLSEKENKSYRLPTDEEWSIAVGLVGKEKHGHGITPEMLAGKETTLFPWEGDYPPRSSDNAGNYADSAWLEKFPTESGLRVYSDGFPTTAPVMSFKPNKLGLYDMGGNVWEWLDDWWNSSHQAHVQRGGSFAYHMSNLLLSSCRASSKIGHYANNSGFRVVLADGPVQPSVGSSAKPQSSDIAPSVASQNQLSLGTTVDLLRLINPANDTVRGRWEWTPEGLKLFPKIAVSTIEFPYEPPEFYDFTIEFSVKEGKHRQVDQILTCQGVPTSWQMGAGYAGQTHEMSN